MKLSRRTALLAIATAVGMPDAMAQDYPLRDIRIVVPYAPGGGNDIFARLISDEVARRLGRPVYIENKPGAGGNIGAEAAARAEPDGYTLLMANNAFTINPSIYSELRFDVTKDFAPLSLVASSPMLVVVSKDSGIKSVADLISFAKQNPGKLNYGTPGVGTPQHMATELFKGISGTDIVHVPFRGTGPSVTGLLRNDVQLMFATPASVDQFVKAGDLTAIAVTSGQAMPEYEKVPTLAASGVSNFNEVIWWGLVAPAGVPAAIQDKIATAIREAVASPAVSAKIRQQVAEPKTSTQDEFAKLIKAEIPQWKRVASEAGVRAQ